VVFNLQKGVNTILHLQISTENEVGHARRNRNLRFWLEMGIEPTIITTPTEMDAWTFFSDDLRRYIRGSKGCLVTHRAAWQKFLESGEELCLISEDDAIPEFDVKKQIYSLSQFLEMTVGLELDEESKPILVQLGWHLFPRITFRQVLVSAFHFMKFHGPVKNGYTRGFSYGTHTYVLNRNMAEYISQTITSETIPLDVQLKTLSEFYIGSEILFVRANFNYSHQERLDSGIVNISAREYLKKQKFLSLRECIQSLADANSTRYDLRTLLKMR
jgi:GR25 family glycosyltransferase involved in LPS biosynthesis